MGKDGKRVRAISEDIVKMDSLVEITPRAVMVTSGNDPELNAEDQQAIRYAQSQELDMMGTIRNRRYSTSKAKKNIENAEAAAMAEKEESDSSSQVFLRNALNTH